MHGSGKRKLLTLTMQQDGEAGRCDEWSSHGFRNGQVVESDDSDESDPMGIKPMMLDEGFYWVSLLLFPPVMPSYSPPPRRQDYSYYNR
jgi:hypothetical protein